MTLWLLATVAATVAAMPARHTGALYTIDASWPQNKEALAGAFFTAVAVEPNSGYVHAAQRNISFPEPVLVFDRSGRHLYSWGSRVMAKSSTKWGVHGLNLQYDVKSNTSRFWITDVVAHTVSAVQPPAMIERILGTPQVAGTGTNPLQFGNVADVDFDGPSIFISDGDGGVNNRVLAFADINASEPKYIRGTAGVQLGQFSSPHSITYHAASNTLFVADRGNNRTQQLSAATGVAQGEWTCMRPGTPWGLRVYVKGNLLFQADGSSHRVLIFSLDKVTGSEPGPCVILQSIPIPSTICETPHELAIDEENGYVYLACVNAANPGLVRLIPADT